MSSPSRTSLTEPRWLRYTLITAALFWLGLFLLLPLAIVFYTGLSQGVKVYMASLTDSATYAAMTLTLSVALVSVVLNTIFGVAAAWTIARFNFYGKSLLLTLIDLPFAVSPVIAGLIFLLVFGRQGWTDGRLLFHVWPWIYYGSLIMSIMLVLMPAITWMKGRRFRSAQWIWSVVGALGAITVLLVDAPIRAWTQVDDVQIIFAAPGIALATLFVTFPFVVRELIPLMESIGTEEEEAAISLGASGWQMFWRITVPNIKWGLMYGIILCNARAMGEFGAVSVISGKIRGQTNTIPLHVENLYNEYQHTAAFAVASLLAVLALVTLAAKSYIEWRIEHRSSGTDRGVA